MATCSPQSLENVPYRLDTLLLYHIAREDLADPGALAVQPNSHLDPENPAHRLPLLPARTNQGWYGIGHGLYGYRLRKDQPDQPAWQSRIPLVYQLELNQARLTILPGADQVPDPEANPWGQLPRFTVDLLADLVKRNPAEVPQVVAFKSLQDQEPYAYALLPHCPFKVIRALRWEHSPGAGDDPPPRELPLTRPHDAPESRPRPGTIEVMLAENRRELDRLTAAIPELKAQTERDRQYYRRFLRGTDSYRNGLDTCKYRERQEKENQQQIETAQKEIQYWQTRGAAGADLTASLAELIKSRFLPDQQRAANWAAAAAHRSGRDYEHRRAKACFSPRETAEQDAAVAEMRGLTQIEVDRVAYWQQELQRLETAVQENTDSPPATAAAPNPSPNSQNQAGSAEPETNDDPLGPLAILFDYASLALESNDESCYRRYFRHHKIKAAVTKPEYKITSRRQFVALTDAETGAPLGQLSYKQPRNGWISGWWYWPPGGDRSETGNRHLDGALNRAISYIAEIREKALPPPTPSPPAPRPDQPPPSTPPRTQAAASQTAAPLKITVPPPPAKPKQPALFTL